MVLQIQFWKNVIDVVALLTLLCILFTQTSEVSARINALIRMLPLKQNNCLGASIPKKHFPVMGFEVLRVVNMKSRIF